ncbi:MAG: carboxypeptidase regulatory-like domain-containing protein [Fibrobacteres bacterium]|nr:carboxypeptidase regulatory-like domain-containing protein [Fibrobacterota bacterium]
MKKSLLLSCLLVAAGMANAAVTISGTVRDTSGKALDSVRLSLQVPGGATLARDTTGADGVFSISSDSTKGKLVLRATSMGSTSYTTKSDTIELFGSDTSGIVIKMVPVPAPVKSTVSGKIDSAGSATALNGAIVTLRGTGGGATTLRDTTGADGLYSFAGVTTGAYTLSVSATGYTAKSVTDTVKADPKTINVSLVAIVTSTVSGKIDSAGSATVLNGAIVTLRGTGGGATTLRDTTGADGLYSFAGVTTGAYTLSVSATGYTAKNVTDTVKADPKTINVSLEAIVTSTVSGKIDSAGSATALNGAVVTLRGTGAGAATLRDTTGADGLYSFAGVTTGAYTLSVSATGYAAKSVTDTVKADPKTINVSLEAIVTSTVSGKIDSAGSATALNGAVVTLRGTGAGAATLRDTTGADGLYSFANVAAGAYTLSVSATGYTAKSVTDTVKADPKTINVSLVAIVTSTVSGKIDSAGSATALNGAVVTLRGTGAGAATLRDTTGADGLYSFAGVTTGAYTLSVSATGYTTKNVTDTVKADPKTINVSLVAVIPAKTILISGTISDSTGAKMDSVYVSLRSTGAGASTLARDTTGADGAFSISTTSISGKFVLRLIDLKSTKDTLIDTITLDSADLSHPIVWKKTVKAGVGNLVKANRAIEYAHGVLKLGAMSTAGSVRVFNAKGELMEVRSFASGAQVTVRLGETLAKGNYILSIVQSDATLQKQIVIQ